MEDKKQKEHTEIESECSINDKLLLVTSILNFITLIIVLIKLLLK